MRIGLDLGGTKIEGIALGDDGRVLARRRVATPQHDYAATVHALAALARTVAGEAGAAGDGDGAPSVGIGIPGAVTPAGTVKNANSTWLIGRPLGRDLEAALGRPVRLANDANCFALSEAADGAGAGARCVFGVILGTGVGGGVVLDGRVHVGANLVGGEWGHNPLPWPTDMEHAAAPPCYCGRRGCIETWLSGPGLAADHARVTGESQAAPAIVAAAEAGDTGARDALARYHDRLARALGTLVNVLDPDVIVLGGGMSNVPGLAEAVGALLPRHVFTDAPEQVVTRVVRNAHGDASGVRGAAWLWPARGAAEAA